MTLRRISAQTHKTSQQLNMQNSVARPDTNRGIAAGVNQPAFGAFRDNKFSFPNSAFDWQAAQDNNSLSIIAANFTMAPIEQNFDVRWDVGTLLFVKKDNNLGKSFCDITMFRTTAATAASAALSTTTTPHSMHNVLDRKDKKNPMGDLASIAENFEPAGVCIGPTSPGMMQTVTDDFSTVRYSGNLKTIGLVIKGHTPFPNLFSNEELRGGQQLYFFVKMVTPPSKIMNAAGDTVRIPAKLGFLVPDLVFFTRKDDGLPERQSSEAMRILAEKKGEQPPLDDFSYIDWQYSGTSLVPTHGILRQGLLYKLGTCLHYYKASNDRLPGQKKESLQYVTDYRSFPMIEIMLNIERIYGSA